MTYDVFLVSLLTLFNKMVQRSEMQSNSVFGNPIRVLTVTFLVCGASKGSSPDKGEFTPLCRDAPRHESGGFVSR